MTPEQYAMKKLQESEAAALKIFNLAPPQVGFFFPRPLSGRVREVMLVMLQRAFVEGVNSTLRDGGRNNAAS